ncbi:MAG: hypothetical protein HRT69_13695 [Flavobacteriaceae bacterium]|nr:hypothetical protein [Flavobacteriaceae bacterium]
MNNKIWYIVLLMYAFLLAFIAFIAFWDQDFNKPASTIGSYLTELHKYKNPVWNDSTNKDLEGIIFQIMKKSNDNAGDLQELAGQSFNIILGSLLAFLSASATMVFQNKNKNKNKNKDVKKETNT